MSFTALTAAEIAVGKAIKKELFLKIKNDLDDHESRIAALSFGTTPIEIFNVDISAPKSATSLNGALFYEAISAFTISSIELQIFTKGLTVSGILEIDVKKNSSPSNAGMVTVLTTKPFINFAVSPDDSSNSGILDIGNQAVLAGDFLRLDITAMPAIGVSSFRVLAYGTAS